MDFETTPNTTEFDYDDVIVNDTRPYISPELLQFTGVTFICIGVFGTIANIIAIAGFTCSKDLRSPPIVYMINLSVSEVLMCAVLLPFWGIYYIQVSCPLS
ncbi:melanopsin-A-like [Oratosquilla oratoria]|uniref:melanopsin-A-like n=1 Tax=Oratosquilla oratoria TaxID=337810 RepID=UPI003F76DE72